MGSNREESNIAFAILEKFTIWTYPISPFKEGQGLNILHRYTLFENN